MKRFNSILLCTMMLFAAFIASCSSGGDDLGDGNNSKPLSNEAKVYFIYTLDTSSGESMTRASTTNEEVFNEFYEKIQSGDLVAPMYELTLTEVNTGAVYTFKGNWKNHDLVTLRTGKYKVIGKSTADGDYIQDKCSFTFDETIEISITSNAIILHAKYDSSLLIFNNSEIKSLQNYDGVSLTSFYNFSTYKYAFVKNLLYPAAKKNEAYILGKYTDDAEFKIFTGNLSFEKGKYYVYNSISNGFNVPPMEDGSEINREIEGFGRVANSVDLGLSVKWASWNVGASKIADYGGLYGAGDPTGLLTSTSYSAYNYNTISSSSICGTEYDLAHVKWGDGWRMPTIDELKELNEKCTWTYGIVIDDVIGAMATGPNGNTLFIPYAGARNGTSNTDFKHHASIWSGDKGYAGSTSYSYSYKDLDVNIPSNGNRLDGCTCYSGQSIRPVKAK